jgi:hypothetical protein
MTEVRESPGLAQRKQALMWPLSSVNKKKIPQVTPRVHACNPSYLGRRQEDLKFKTSLGKEQDSISEARHKQNGWEGGAQEVEHLHSMHEALGLIPVPQRKGKKKKMSKVTYMSSSL